MGAWGTAILSDDTARDVYDEYVAKYNDGLDHTAIYDHILKSFASSIHDSDDGPVFWLALAKAQWDCGVLQDHVLQKVVAIVNNGEDLTRWREQGEKTLKKRQKVLDTFITMISTPKEKPRKPHRIKKVEAVFQAGTCLAVRLPNGEYGAAIVLAADNSHKTEGKNLIGLLTYKHPEKPTLKVFGQRKWLNIFGSRKWLKLTHHKWQGNLEIVWCLARQYKKYADLFEIIGMIDLESLDPKENPYYWYSSWDSFSYQRILQHEWDSGVRT